MELEVEHKQRERMAKEPGRRQGELGQKKLVQVHHSRLVGHKGPTLLEEVDHREQVVDHREQVVDHREQVVEQESRDCMNCRLEQVHC